MERRSSAFVREAWGGQASGSALLVDHRCLSDAWRSSRHASKRKLGQILLSWVEQKNKEKARCKTWLQ